MRAFWSGFLSVMLIPFVWTFPLNDSCEFHSGKKLIYPVGTTWEIRVGSHTDFQCLDCSCLPHSTVRCLPSRKTCPALDNCLKFEHVPDSCCPKCTEVRNDPEPEPSSGAGETVSLTYTERRSVTDCFHAGQVFADGQRWSPDYNTTAIRPVDADTQCVQCHCQDGQTMCYLKTCPVLSCDTVLVSDNCCPVCADGEHSTEETEVAASDYDRHSVDASEEGNLECVSGSERYEDGTQWHPVIPPFGRMKCVLCECDNGQIKCKKVTCPNKPTCTNPITKPGFCCPICPTETNEIANVSASGPYVCLKHKDYLLYEHLHGTTIEIALSLPEEEMMWISRWNVNAYQDTNISSSELKSWEFRRTRPVEDYKFLGTAKSKRVNRFFRRLNKIRHTCRHRCTKRMERLIALLRIQAVYTGSKSNCPENFRPVDTRL